GRRGGPRGARVEETNAARGGRGVGPPPAPPAGGVGAASRTPSCITVLLVSPASRACAPGEAPRPVGSQGRGGPAPQAGPTRSHQGTPQMPALPAAAHYHPTT